MPYPAAVKTQAQRGTVDKPWDHVLWQGSRPVCMSRRCSNLEPLRHLCSYLHRSPLAAQSFTFGVTCSVKRTSSMPAFEAQSMRARSLSHESSVTAVSESRIISHRIFLIEVDHVLVCDRKRQKKSEDADFSAACYLASQ